VTTKTSGRLNRPRLWLTPWPTRGFRVNQFAEIVALMVAIAQDPWLHDSRTAEQGEPWRTVPISGGGGIVEYAINEADHKVILTRIFPF